MKIDLDEVLKQPTCFHTLQWVPHVGWQVAFWQTIIKERKYCVTDYCSFPTAALRRMAELTNDKELLEMLTPMSSIDWDRWHELLDIRAQRALTTSEEQEHEEYARIAALLDAEEGGAADATLGKLVKKHERVIASIRRLTAAVRAAAEAHPTAPSPRANRNWGVSCKNCGAVPIIQDTQMCGSCTVDPSIRRSDPPPQEL